MHPPITYEGCLRDTWRELAGFPGFAELCAESETRNSNANDGRECGFLQVSPRRSPGCSDHGPEGDRVPLKSGLAGFANMAAQRSWIASSSSSEA